MNGIYGISGIAALQAFVVGGSLALQARLSSVSPPGLSELNRDHARIQSRPFPSGCHTALAVGGSLAPQAGCRVGQPSGPQRANPRSRPDPIPGPYPSGYHTALAVGGSLALQARLSSVSPPGLSEKR
jgi:hypothetical protein